METFQGIIVQMQSGINEFPYDVFVKPFTENVNLIVHVRKF